MVSVSKITFSAFAFLCLDQVSANLTGYASSTFDDKCERCLTRGYDYCSQDEYFLEDGGKCCVNLLYSGDYCNASYKYCTQSKVKDNADSDSDPT